MKTRRLVATVLVSACFYGPYAAATVGYQFNGLGQYELGMSGAVVAAPGDAMTVITNPAGLAEVPAQGDASAELFNPLRSVSFGQGTVGSHTNVYGVPELGWVAPVGYHQLFLGGGLFGTAGLGVNYLQQPYLVPNPGNPGQLIPAALQAYTNMSMMVAPLGVGWRLSPRWSLGAALDLANETVSFQDTESGTQNGIPFNIGVSFASPASAYGVGVTVGALYRLNAYTTFGASYRSPLWFTPLTWIETSESIPNPSTGGISVSGGAGQYSMRLNYPQQIAFGAALRPVRRLLVSLQGQWINWRSTLNTVSISGPWQQGGSVVMATRWRNSWVGSLGVQYALVRGLTLRTGYAYGSSPISADNLYTNLIAPAVVTNQATLGATEDLGDDWRVTEAYMHAFKSTISSVIPGTAIPISTSLSENAFGVQLNYLF